MWKNAALDFQICNKEQWKKGKQRTCIASKPGNTALFQERAFHLRAFDTSEDSVCLKHKWEWKKYTSNRMSAAICACTVYTEGRTVCCCPQVSMCVSGMCMTIAIIILGRWSDLSPTNYVWPASQDRVPSVWCCPTPHWLVNEGLCGGVRAGWRGGEVRGGVGLPLLLQLQACFGPAVDSQLLLHHNKHRPHKGRPAEQSRPVWGPPPPKKKPWQSISPLSLRKQSCLYWALSE